MPYHNAVTSLVRPVGRRNTLSPHTADLRSLPQFK